MMLLNLISLSLLFNYLNKRLTSRLIANLSLINMLQTNYKHLYNLKNVIFITMNKRYFIVGCLFVLLLYSCKKDIDTTKPIIEINTPANNQQFNVLDTIAIKGIVTDNEGVDYITVSFKNEQNLRVLPSITRQVSSKSYSINLPFYFNDIHLPSGKYYFDIIASDGENTTHEFINIKLLEVNKERIGVFFFSGNQQVTEIYSFENNLAVNYMTINGDFLTAEVNSYYQQLAVCGQVTGNLSVVDLNTDVLIWVENSLATNPYYFTNLNNYNNKWYLGYYSGKIKSFGKYGEGGGFSVLTHQNTYPEACLITDEYVFSEQNSKAGGNIDLVTYYTSGLEKQSYTINKDVVSMHEYLSNSIILIVNNSSNSEVLSYDVYNNFLYNKFTINTNIDKCIEVSKGVYLAIAGNDVIKIDLPNNSISNYLMGVSATSIAYDSVNMEVFIIIGNQIVVYDYLTKTQKWNYNHTNAIEGVAFRYNK